MQVPGGSDVCCVLWAVRARTDTQPSRCEVFAVTLGVGSSSGGSGAAPELHVRDVNLLRVSGRQGPWGLLPGCASGMGAAQCTLLLGCPVDGSGTNPRVDQHCFLPSCVARPCLAAPLQRSISPRPQRSTLPPHGVLANPEVGSILLALEPASDAGELGGSSGQPGPVQPHAGVGEWEGWWEGWWEGGSKRGVCMEEGRNNSPHHAHALQLQVQPSSNAASHCVSAHLPHREREREEEPSAPAAACCTCPQCRWMIVTTR